MMLIGTFSKYLRISARRRNGVSLESYPVPMDFAERAYMDKAAYERIYESSIGDPDAFGASRLVPRLDQAVQPDLDTNFDAGDFRIRWFADGTLNASVNCVDSTCRRKPTDAAILWEGDTPGESRAMTWSELATRSTGWRTC